jgi:hypothetical protein
MVGGCSGPGRLGAASMTPAATVAQFCPGQGVNDAHLQEVVWGSFKAMIQGVRGGLHADDPDRPRSLERPPELEAEHVLTMGGDHPGRRLCSID